MPTVCWEVEGTESSTALVGILFLDSWSSVSVVAGFSELVLSWTCVIAGFSEIVVLRSGKLVVSALTPWFWFCVLAMVKASVVVWMLPWSPEVVGFGEFVASWPISSFWSCVVAGDRAFVVLRSISRSPVVVGFCESVVLRSIGKLVASDPVGPGAPAMNHKKVWPILCIVAMTAANSQLVH